MVDASHTSDKPKSPDAAKAGPPHETFEQFVSKEAEVAKKAGKVARVFQSFSRTTTVVVDNKTYKVSQNVIQKYLEKHLALSKVIEKPLKKQELTDMINSVSSGKMDRQFLAGIEETPSANGSTFSYKGDFTTVLGNKKGKNFLTVIKMIPKSYFQCRDIHGNTLLDLAVQQGNIEAVKHAIEKKGANVNMLATTKEQEADSSHTPLHSAIKLGSVEMVKILLFKGAENHTNGQGYKALNYAISEKKPEIVTLIMDLAAKKTAHINVTFQTKSEMSSALHTAIKSGDEKMVGLVLSKLKLLGYENCINSLNNDSEKPFYTAIKKETPNMKIVEFLLDNGAENPLHIALLPEKPNIEILKFILEKKKANVTDQDDKGFTPLHIALFQENPNIDIIKFLLDNGAKIDAKNKDGDTPLHIFLKQNNPNIEIIKLLFEKDKQIINANNEQGDSPLHIFLKQNNPNIKIINFLLDSGAKIDAKNAEGNTPLQTFLKQEKPNKAILELLLKDNLHLLHSGNLQGHTPLHIVLMQKNPDIATIKFLIAQDPSIIKATNLQGDTALHIVLKQDNPSHEIIELLLEKGLTLAATNVKGDTPLHTFMKQKNPNKEILTFLLKITNVNAPNEQGDTPLHTFLKQKNPNKEILELLLKSVDNINAKNEQGNTPLHTFLMQENPNKEILELLLEKGAKIDDKNGQGNTPLHIAMNKYTPKNIVALLINEDIINAQNKEGNTPLHIILDQPFPNKDTVDLLLKKNADPNIENNLKKTPYSIYKMRKHVYLGISIQKPKTPYER